MDRGRQVHVTQAQLWEAGVIIPVPQMRRMKMKTLKELAPAHSGLKILISLVPKSLLAPLGKSVEISAPEFSCKRLRKGHLVVTKDQMTCRECSSPADKAPCLAKEMGFPTQGTVHSGLHLSGGLLIIWLALSTGLMGTGRR